VPPRWRSPRGAARAAPAQMTDDVVSRRAIADRHTLQTARERAAEKEAGDRTNLVRVTAGEAQRAHTTPLRVHRRSSADVAAAQRARVQRLLAAHLCGGKKKQRGDACQSEER